MVILALAQGNLVAQLKLHLAAVQITPINQLAKTKMTLTVEVVVGTLQLALL
jgi:hypothetical protein